MKSIINRPDYNESHEICSMCITPELLRNISFPLEIPNSTGNSPVRIIDFITCDRENILYRQKIFSDIQKNPELISLIKYISESLDEISSLSRLTGTKQLDNEQLLYTFRELTIFTDFITEVSEKIKKLRPDVTSEGLLSFFDEIDSIKNNPGYEGVKEYLNLFTTNMRELKSITIGINLDPQLNMREAGLVSINQSPFISDTFVDRIFRNKDFGDDFHCLATLGMKESGLSLKSGTELNLEFYRAMNTVMSGLLKKMKKNLDEEILSKALSLMQYTNEFRFIDACAKYLNYMSKKGMTYVMPSISEVHRISRLYNPNLAEKIPVGSIVKNTVTFDDNGTIFVLTGPNSGGKSVLIKAIAIAQVMFQLGLPVSADEAELLVYKNMFIHFAGESGGSVESRLVTECKAMKNICSEVSSESIVFLDETFSSTSAFEATVMSKEILRFMSRKRCRCIFATHLHELAQMCDKFQYSSESDGRIKALSMEIADGKRTFRLTEDKDCGDSYARDIFTEHGLEFIYSE